MSEQSIRKRISNSPLGKLYRLRHRLKTTRRIFTEAYLKNVWNSAESASGTGSTLKQTETLRALLPQLLAELNVKTLLDAPCGDFNWMKEVNLNLEKYIGVDIVEPIISENNRKYSRADREFIALNIITDALPSADLILCRDVFIHHRYRDIFKTVENFKRSGAKHLLTTTFPARSNEELEIEGLFRPINLQAAPFNFPMPVKLIDEHCTEVGYEDKSLGLWLLSSL